jgi:hypothetical protein
VAPKVAGWKLATDMAEPGTGYFKRMKVLDLRCAAGHCFEAWFSSMEEFSSQRSSGFLSCPVCGQVEVERLPSAPRLNLSGAKAPDSTAGAAESSKPLEPVGAASSLDLAEQQGLKEAQGMWLRAAQELVKSTEDVGDRFPEEARRIHYGETAQRGIRGQATVEQRAELAEEGIDTAVFPIPAALLNSRH